MPGKEPMFKHWHSASQIYTRGLHRFSSFYQKNHSFNSLFFNYEPDQEEIISPNHYNNDDYHLNISRLATSERLPDRFINTQTKTSTDPNQAYMGRVFTLVEILSPSLSTSQVGQSIINGFTNNYYRGESTSDLVNFEEALKKVNDTLVKITQNGETNWIGNLNSILTVVIENKIHLAQTGRAEAYIFRDGKVNHITAGLGQNYDPHPVKTYSNVTSGELKINDKLLLTSEDLLKYLDVEVIRQTINLNPPDEAVIQIVKALKKRHAKTVNLLLVEILDKRTASVGNSEDVQTVYLDKPIESYSDLAKRIWQQILSPIIKSLAKSAQRTGTKSVEIIKEQLKKTKQIKKEEKLKEKDLFEKEFLADNHDGLLNDEEIHYSPELNVHYYEEAKKKQTHKKYEKAYYYLNLVLSFLADLFTNKKKRPYLFILAALIIFLSIGGIIKSNWQKGPSKVNAAEAQANLDQAEQLQKQAQNALLNNKVDEAKKLFVEAINNSEKIKDMPVVGRDAVKIINDSYGELDKLTSTTRYAKLTPVLSIEGNIKEVFVLGNLVYMVTSNEIYKGAVSNQKPEKVASIARNNGDVSFGVLTNKNIYLYTNSQNVLDFNLDTEKIQPAKLTEGIWETANSMSFYNDNLYLLDGIVGRIYKHSLTNGVFSKGESYINSPAIDLKNSASLAIDGSLYSLLNNSGVLKLQKGRLQDFSLKDIPTPYSKIEKPLKIYTDQDCSSLYILDGAQKRIIEFDKDGHFVHQYALPMDFNELKDLTITYKSKKMWIINSNSLYQIDL